MACQRLCRHSDCVTYITTASSLLTYATFLFFFFNDPATTEIYTLSLHDALPISAARGRACGERTSRSRRLRPQAPSRGRSRRSEEHTSELQSRPHLVCRLLLEKKKNTNTVSLEPQTSQRSIVDYTITTALDPSSH